MRRIVPVLAALAAFAAPALAYEIDPLTRQPLEPVGGALMMTVRPQAVAPLAPEAPAPQMSAIPREIVAYTAAHSPGTIVVSTGERRLYYVMGGGQAVRYGVGVGRPGFTWGGVQTVTMKREWPDWRPPAQMLRRRPDLPRYMKGGIENPLGARAMYLGGTLYRIHGSNEPETIGQAVSSGCFRMTNEDVTDLYSRVKVGTRVVVVR
jgi:lipoprotein-anchoring transpeptidase ErfK/SrfK